MRQLLFCVLLSCLALAGNAQVPTPKAFLGHELGERYSAPYQVAAYAEALVQAAPDRLRLVRYGQTNEGRPLLVVIATSAKNLQNLEAIRTDNLKRAGLLEGAPSGTQVPVIWLSYGIHGNEASSPDAALTLLYDLATGQTPMLQKALEDVVLIIDPCVNPDGRARFVSYSDVRTGRSPNANPESWEHLEPWPTGRTNHYQYDLNRDWAWQTQAESRARGALYQQWLPQIHADYHEMGSESHYYFLPAAQPYHEVITPWQAEFQKKISAAHVASFDSAGWRYFTRETYDLFYPSYGDTWPIYQGAIGMTYEQGGGLGLHYKQTTGDTVRLKDRVQHHYTTSLNTIRVGWENRAGLLQAYAAYYKAPLDAAPGTYRTFVIKAGNDPAVLKALTELLSRQQIRYGIAQSNSAAKALQGYSYRKGMTESVSIQSGDLLISTQQPKGTLVKVLFEPQTAVPDSLTYDLTAWAVPYAYGLDAYAIKESIPNNTSDQKPYYPNDLTKAGSLWGFLLPNQGYSTQEDLVRLLKDGYQPFVTSAPITVAGKSYPAGSVIVQEQDADKRTAAASLVRWRGIPLASSAITAGPDLGSDYTPRLKAPRVALLAGEQVGTGTLGDIWHFFDEVLQYPITLLPADAIDEVNLWNYDVLILPGGNMNRVFGKDGFETLQRWMSDGGRVVAIEGALGLFAGKDGFSLKAKKDASSDDTSSNRLPYAARERAALSETLAGAIYRADVDTTHPLGFGLGKTYLGLKNRDAAYELLPTGGWNVGVNGTGSRVAGFVGSKLIPKLENALAFGEERVGKGRVIYLADNPLFRGFWLGGRQLLCNAVFLSGF